MRFTRDQGSRTKALTRVGSYLANRNMTNMRETEKGEGEDLQFLKAEVCAPSIFYHREQFPSIIRWACNLVGNAPISRFPCKHDTAAYGEVSLIVITFDFCFCNFDKRKERCETYLHSRLCIPNTKSGRAEINFAKESGKLKASEV